MRIKELSDKIGLDEADYRMLLGIFRESAATDISNLKKALENKALPEAREAAHSLKGASGNMGLMDIYNLASEIESQSMAESMGDLSGMTIKLAGMLNQLKDLE